VNLLQQQVEYLAARSLAGGLGRLPRRVALRLGAALGSVAWRLGARREVVREQIAAAFPERPSGWLDRTARECYRHFGREMVEMVRLQRTGIAGLPARTRTDAATDRWLDDMASGVGALVVTGHLGNWEVAGAYLAARGVPLAAVVKRQSNRKFDAWLAESRRRIGIEPVYRADARRRLPELLAQGRSVALVADQDAHGSGLQVTFLGRPASTFRGPARLALATGAPLVFGAAVREAGGYRVTIEPVRMADPERPATGTRAFDRAERLLTETWVQGLDRHVREHPEQYFWFHRRWKSGVPMGRNEDRGGGVPHANPVDGGKPSHGSESTPMNEETRS